MFVGGLQEIQVHIVLDICVPCEYLFSYNFEIIPLITHIRQILKIDVLKYECNDLFPKVKSDAGTSVAVWSPVVILESCIQSWKYHLIKYSKNILMTCPCCFKKATFNGKYIMSLILYAVSISETLSTEQKWSLVQEALKS
ncbi:putative callose synthase 8 isoform X2 [Phaseolus vulgaris]|uniref:putative callose synthase 8 isoform X2 n=1 Tax=Phaseolus vulgaris TaxID=3885 RepID=UPI0035C9E572